jgi:hypothetical protein
LKFLQFVTGTVVGVVVVVFVVLLVVCAVVGPAALTANKKNKTAAQQ